MYLYSFRLSIFIIISYNHSSSDTYYLNINCSTDVIASPIHGLIYLWHDAIVSFNYGLTHFLSCCHGIFQPWSYSFHVTLPWYLSTMVLFISRHVAMVSFNHGLTCFISGCHGIFQPWCYTFHIRLPWYLSTMVLHISNQRAHSREPHPYSGITSPG